MLERGECVQARRKITGEGVSVYEEGAEVREAADRGGESTGEGEVAEVDGDDAAGGVVKCDTGKCPVGGAVGPCCEGRARILKCSAEVEQRRAVAWVDGGGGGGGGGEKLEGEEESGCSWSHFFRGIGKSSGSVSEGFREREHGEERQGKEREYVSVRVSFSKRASLFYIFKYIYILENYIFMTDNNHENEIMG